MPIRHIYHNAINGAKYAEITSPTLWHTLVAKPIMPNMLIKNIDHPKLSEVITASIAGFSKLK